MRQKQQTLGERIRKIRLPRYQEDVAAQFGVSQGTWSAWENDDPTRPPSPEMCCRLAALATEREDSMFFLRQAGLTPQLIISAAEKIWAERVKPPLEGETIRIPRMGSVARIPRMGSVAEGPEEELLSVPRRMVANPASTVYYVIDEAVKMGAIECGDIVVIDTSADWRRSLESLWGKLVLVKTLCTPGILDESFRSLEKEPDEGLYLGILRCKVDTGFRRGRAGLKDWFVGLEAFDQQTVAFTTPWDGVNVQVIIGEMKITPKDWKLIGAPMSPEELRAKQAEVSRMRFELFDTTLILGRAVGWFRPPSKSGE